MNELERVYKQNVERIAKILHVDPVNKRGYHATRRFLNRVEYQSLLRDELVTRQELPDHAAHVWKYGSGEPVIIDPPKRVFDCPVDEHRSPNPRASIRFEHRLWPN